MATPLQHLTGIDVKLGQIDAALTAKVPVPVNGGTFNPTLIDLSLGQVEYDSYTQTGAITLTLHPDKVPVIGSTIAVNIMGGGFAMNWSTPFIGVEGAASGMLLAAGISHPLLLRYMMDWVEITPGVFADRILVGVLGNALGLFRGGGATVNEVAGAPANPYEFTVGGALTLDPLNPKHRSIKVTGPGDGLLTANMQVTLPDPDLYDEGSEIYVEKGEDSSFTVTVFGFDLLETGTHILRRRDQYIVAKIAGKTSKKWERQKGGQQNPSGFGQDLLKASNAAAVNTLLGTSGVHQPVTAAQAISGVALTRTTQRLLVELIEDLNSNGTFTLPTASLVIGDVVRVVRHGGGLGIWSRTGGTASDVLRARDDIIEYLWSGSAWVRILFRSQQVVRVNAATYTISADDHLADLVFETTPCTVTLPNNIATRTRFRLVQEGSAIATIAPASGSLIMPATGAATATSGDGTALVLTVVQNATGTAARYRVILETPVPATGSGGTGLTPTAIITANHTAVANTLIRVNSAAGGFSVTLPPSPIDGTRIALIDTTSSCELHPVSILRNTKTIFGVADDLLFDGGNYIELIYNQAQLDWDLSSIAQANTGSTALLPADLLAMLITVDGAGSALDADFLDGQNGSFYLDLTGATGTLAAARIADNTLPTAKLQNSTAAIRLFGRGSAAGAGPWQEIVLDPSLTMSGTTLSTAGGISLPLAGGTMAGAITLGTGASIVGGDKVASALELRDTAETVVAKGTLAGAISFDYSAGSYQWGTVGASNITSVAVTNPPVSGKLGALTLRIVQHATTPRTITWGAAFRFVGGVDATLSTGVGSVDFFTLLTDDGGATWYVFEGGKAFAA